LENTQGEQCANQDFFTQLPYQDLMGEQQKQANIVFASTIPSIIKDCTTSMMDLGKVNGCPDILLDQHQFANNLNN
jgi:hypothetical protein